MLDGAIMAAKEQLTISNVEALPISGSNERIYNETTFRESQEAIPLKNETTKVKRKDASGKKRRKSYRNSTDKHHGNGTGNKEERLVKLDNLNCFQYVFFTWMTPLITRIFYRNIKLEQIGICSPYESCRLNFFRIEKFWNKQHPKLMVALYKFVRKRFLLASQFYILCLATGYLSSTFFLKKFLEEIETLTAIPEIIDEDGFGNVTVKTGKSLAGAFQWAAALYVCELLRAMCFSVMFAISIRTGIRTVNGLNGLIYRKILNRDPLAHTGDGGSTVQPNNLFSNDLWKIFQMFYMAPLMIGSPIIIAVTIIYSYLLIGKSAIYGMALFCFIFLVQFLLIRKQTQLRKRIMRQTDQRISLVNQLVKHIRAIKFNGYEIPFKSEIQYCREAESKIIKVYQYLQCISTSMALLTPMMITIINILVHTWLGNDLTVSTAFSLLMLNYIAAHGIRSLPNYFREIVNGRIAMRRIEKFLCTEDQKNYIDNEMIDNEMAIEMVNCSFIWTDSQNRETFQIPGITLLVPKKSHVCLYGPVGSGKTALLLSIMGQTRCSYGGVVKLFSKKIAYVSQKPWLQNATIRENILFGSPLENDRYFETLMKCCLTEDISMFSHGDETMVGENGVKLSGGQKQRIALARAVYSCSDIYFIDDCFSALDTGVLKAIFSNVINGLLKYKTVLFVTRHLYLLEPTDMVVILNDGRIEQMNKHEKLMETSNEYRKWVEESKILPDESTNTDDEPEITSESDPDPEETLPNDDNEPKFLGGLDKKNGLKDIKKNDASYNSLLSLMAEYDEDHDESETPTANGKENGKSKKKWRNSMNQCFIKFKESESNRKYHHQEPKHKRSVSWSVYKDYIQAGGGWIPVSIMILFFILQSATSTFSNWWLSYWLRQGSGTDLLIQQNGTITGNLTEISSSILQNPKLHLYQAVYLILFAVVIITSLLMAISFVRVITLAANTLHNQILEKIVHSSLGYLDSIKIGKIINLFSHNMDELDNQLPVELDGFLQRSLMVIGNFIIIIILLYWFTVPFICFVLAFYLVFRYYRKAVYWLKQADMRLRSPIYGFVNSTVDGLSIIKAFNAESQFEENFYELCNKQIAANYYSHCSVRWLSIRIDIICIITSMAISLFVLFNLDYIGAAYAGLLITQSLQLSGLLQLVIRLALELETRLVSVERIRTYIQWMQQEKSIQNLNHSNQDIPNDWPNKMRVSFRDVSLRYSNRLPVVLDKVSFDVPGGKKLAIVGRTGAGKSSITYALFRLVECFSGTIYIDNVDIKKIPLRVLRSKLSIIPQDPTIFQGTVRKNLDPLMKTPDEELMKAIEQVHLGEKIKSFPNGLNETISEEHFSTGEKQLLCMARALLRKSKLIVLDEATSSMDDQTEKDIWTILQNNFHDCTIILIAHRLQTVFQCDQLIVIHKGKIIEQGSPTQLQNDHNSNFYKMISAA